MKTSYFTPSVIGAGYGVYTDKACTQAVGALWIGTVGKNYDVASNLPLGTYYVKEFYAPEGYELDEEVYMVKLTQNGQMAVVNSVEPTTEPHGNIRVVKSTYFNDPVVGTGFGIYCALEHNVDTLWMGLDGGNGDTSVDLPFGTYYVKECYTLDGNVPDEDIYSVTLKEDGETVVVNSVGPTAKPHGNIKVCKASYFNDPVVGTGFGIYNNKDCTLEHNVDTLWIGLKGDDSDISIDLPLGTYYVKEYYTLADNYADDEIHTVTLANDGDMVTVTSIAPTKKRSWKCQGCKEIKLICPRNWRRIRNIQR
ncbi:MAG TPA: prealbumin-like fold domain-containing protein [Candidatus Blautia excrementipullorum]|nr:prealbumin-like fold domain-containing protein [Candidatus Blautia excrementipullorum]